MITYDELHADLTALHQRSAELDMALARFQKAVEKIVALQKPSQQEQLVGTRDHEQSVVEALIEAAQVVVLVLDSGGRIVRFNAYMEEISGYSLEEVRGQDWFTLFLPMQDVEQSYRLFFNTSNDTQVRGVVTPIKTRAGNERQIEWYHKTLKDVGGSTIGVLSIGLDMTERLGLEEAYRTLVDHSLQGLFIFQNQRFVFVNPTLSQVSGYSTEELLSMNTNDVLALIHPEDRLRIQRSLKKELKNKFVHSHYECRIIRKNGEMCWLEMSPFLPCMVVSQPCRLRAWT